MYSRSKWIEDIELEPGPHETAQRVAWIILVDAIDRSMMSDHPEAPIKKSNAALSAMIESRQWLMDDSDLMPGDVMSNGMVSGASRNSCLSVINISQDSIKSILRHLWRQVDGRMGDTLWAELKASREALMKEKQGNMRLNSWREHKRRANTRHKLLLEAARIRSESMEWV